MEQNEIRFEGEDLNRISSAAIVLAVLAGIGLGIPVFLLLTDDFTFGSLFITVFIVLVMVALWAWYNENDTIVVSKDSIRFDKRLLTRKYKTIATVDLNTIKEVSVTKVLHHRLPPKSLLTFVQHDETIIEKWVRLVMVKEQENELKKTLDAKGIITFFEE